MPSHIATTLPQNYVGYSTHHFSELYDAPASPEHGIKTEPTPEDRFTPTPMRTQSRAETRQSAVLDPAARIRRPRSVAHLTPAQRERKRANDRKAQRQIRERTKATIATLQSENAALRTQVVSHPLIGELQQSNAALQAEVNALKDALRNCYCGQGASMLPVASVQPMAQPMAQPAYGLNTMEMLATPTNHLGVDVGLMGMVHQPEYYAYAGAPLTSWMPAPSTHEQANYNDIGY